MALNPTWNKSILDQDCLDQIEVVWHDDCSIDDTQLLVQDNLKGVAVKKIIRKSNRYQKGIPFWLDIIEACDGDYIALLEGDDFWSDSKKLSKQISLLNSLPNINICFTKAQIVDYLGEDTGNSLAEYGNVTAVASLSDVIKGDGGFMPTASIVIRKSALMNAPNWFYEFQPVGDYMFQVLGSIPNGAVYIPEFTCKYRTGDPSSWTQSTSSDPMKFSNFEVKFIELLIKMRATLPKSNEDDFNFIINKHFNILINHSFKLNKFNDLDFAFRLLR